MRPFTKKALLSLALSGGLVALSGCAEYFDRRDTIALSSGNAVATDKVTHMVDPWPPVSADKNLEFNGERMENAMQRYRTNRTYEPSGTGTSATYDQAKKPENTTPVGPTVTQAAAPTK
jgi:hypothetical protein